MMININLLLAWGASFKKLATEQIIFKEGTRSHFYFQLVSGKVRWVNINDEGKEFIQAMVEPGECFGELPLFDGEPFAATAIAEEDSVIIRLHAATFHQLIREHPEMHSAFTKLLAQKLRFKLLMTKEFANNSPEHRISWLISYLKEKENNRFKKEWQVKLTRQQIADMTGLRVETVIRTIRNLHEKGWLHIEKGKVYC
jgi:CRP/FNR family cyclic AMP-dependent transcriptional regulator